MNEQSTMMNQQQQQQQLMNMSLSLMSTNQMNPQPQPQPQVIKFNQIKPSTHPSVMSQSSDLISFRPQIVQTTRTYGTWSQPLQFSNPNPGAMKPSSSAFNKSLGPRSNWKGKKVNKPNDKRRVEQQKTRIAGSSTGGIGEASVISGGGGKSNFNNYDPPNLNELQHQNRLKTRKFFPKKKFNKNSSMNMNTSGNNSSRSAPFAPRNTTSFLIRAKKSGGIAPLVSPYPVTPAVLPTPIFSPSREVLVDMAKEEWGVDGYGSMKGLIRLRSPGHEMEAHEDEEDEGSSSESDVEEHVEVERRLDHDLSRFEMIYNPNSNVTGMEYNNVLENRVDDQDSHIAQLEEENLILKERLFLMERELGELTRRMLCLERRRNRGEEINEEIIENESENESESRAKEPNSLEDDNEDFKEENIRVDRCTKVKGNAGPIAEGFGAATTTENIVELDTEGKVESKDNWLDAADENNIASAEFKEESNNDSDELIKENRSVENNNDKERCEDAEVKVKGGVNIEPCERVMVGGDVGMLEDAVAEENTSSEKDAAN